MIQFKILFIVLFLAVLTTSARCDETKKTRTYILAKDGSHRRIKVEEQSKTREKGQDSPSGSIYLEEGDTVIEFNVLPLPISQSPSFESRRVITSYVTPNAEANSDGDYTISDTTSDSISGTNNDGDSISGTDGDDTISHTVSDTASDSTSGSDSDSDDFWYDSQPFTFIEDEGESYKKSYEKRLWSGTTLLDSKRLQFFVTDWKPGTSNISRDIILPIGAFEVNNTIVYPRFQLDQAYITEDGVTLTGRIRYSTRNLIPPPSQSLETGSTANSSDDKPEHSASHPLLRQIKELRSGFNKVRRRLNRVSADLFPPGIYVYEEVARAEVLLSITEDGGILLRRLEVIAGESPDHDQETTPIDGLVVTLAFEQNDNNQVNNPSPEDEADKLPEATGLTQGITLPPYFHFDK